MRRLNLDPHTTTLAVPRNSAPQEQKLLVGAAVLIGAALAIAALFLLSDIGASSSFPYLFLLPWLFGLAVVIATPSLVLYRSGKFKIANPIVFASAFYFFPPFVVGGVILALGGSQPFYLDFIQDPTIDLPFTVVLVAMGFSGLAVGYFMRWPKRLATRIGNRLPAFELPTNSYFLPALMLAGIGIASVYVGIYSGILGFVFAEQWNSYDGLIVAATQFWMEGVFLIWFIVFKRGRLDSLAVSVLGLILLIYSVDALFSGSRAVFLRLIIAILIAFTLSGVKMRTKHALWFGTALVVCLFIGVVYGTAFRNVKGGEDVVSISEYSGNIFETFDSLTRDDSLELMQFASGTLAARMEALSSLAVVVSNYEKLAPYEEAYGLRNNILNDIMTFFVPRIIWNEKSQASDARKYSELYFNYGGSSFLITPIGDLLRNFGVVGVPIGMFLLGMLLRFIYSLLIESGPVTPWKAAIYYMLLTSVNYETFYGSIIANLVKFGFTAIVGMIIVLLFARWISGTNVTLKSRLTH